LHAHPQKYFCNAFAAVAHADGTDRFGTRFTRVHRRNAFRPQGGGLNLTHALGTGSLGRNPILEATWNSYPFSNLGGAQEKHT